MSRRTAVMLLCASLGIGCGGGSSGHDPAYQLPTVHDDHVVTAEDTPLELEAAILANDDVSCQPQVRIGAPQHGKIDRGYPSGKAEYTPDPGFHGTDAFTYTVHDCAGDSDPATITVTVMSDGIPYEQARSIDQTPVAALAAGDIDGDGKIDLVVADTDHSSVVVLLDRTASPGAYAVEPARFEGGHAPTSVAVADLDGDGRPDIVTASGNDGLVVLRNLTVAGAAIAFDAPVYLAAGHAVGVVATDLDGDGRADLASIDSAGHLDVRLNTSGAGALAFGARTTFAAPIGALQLEAVDADGSGGMDLVVLSAVPYPATNRGDGTFSLFVNATAVGAAVPAFAARVDRATGRDPKSIFVADLDGDHRPEIGVLDDGLWIYANQSAAGAAPSYEAARVLDVDPTAQLAAPVDLDGQGDTDLVLGTQAQDPLSVLLNRSTPTSGYAFDAHQSILGANHARAATGTPRAIRFVELDGVSPAEIVVGGTAGTLVLYGD